MNFDGKIVRVTGASGGIGRAVALEFAKRNARVAVNYHSNQAAAEETLAALPGTGHMLVQADIADPNAVQRMVQSVIDQMGGLDILVNNAGVYTDHPIDVVDYDTWQQHWRHTINTNLIGVANACYWAAQHIMTHACGTLVDAALRGE